MTDQEEMVCVGGWKDGARVRVAAGARYVEFASRVPMPDDGLLYTSRETVEMTYRTAVYETFALAVRADRLFQILVPVGTKPAEAMENLLAGYRLPPQHG